jgi:polar amino acid transport system substrate-binding protein
MENKTVLIGLVVIGLIVGFLVYPLMSQAQAANEGEEAVMEKINREGKLRACYIYYPPFVIEDPNTGELSGESIDAIEYIANETDLEVEYTETAWGTFIAALQSKQCDVVVTGLFSTMERAKSIAFTQPIAYIGNSVLIRQGDTRFKSLDDFNKPDIKIAVMQGEVGHLYAQKNLPNAELVVLPGADISLALAQVSSGQVDAAFTDDWVVSSYAKEHPETQDFLEVNSTASYGINPVSWAVRQEDTDLLNFLNTATINMQAEGKFLEFEEKYDAHWLRQPFELEKS